MMHHPRLLCSEDNDIFAQYRVPWASTAFSLPGPTTPLLPNYYPRLILGCTTTPSAHDRPSLQIPNRLWTCKRRANIADLDERLHKPHLKYGRLP
jgi:hypothetical protein